MKAQSNERCSCTHLASSHFDGPGKTRMTGPCAKDGCSCQAFSLKKVPSPAGRQAALKAWETIRNKKADKIDHDDLMVFCDTDHQLYAYAKAVQQFLGIEENAWGEDVVQFDCSICGLQHASRVLGRR